MDIDITDISSHLNNTIEIDTKLSLRAHNMSEITEENLESAVKSVLSAYNNTDFMPVLYTMIKELVINGIKANHKRIFFEENSLNLLDQNDYRKGMAQFKKLLRKNMSHEFGLKARSAGLFCLVDFYMKEHGIKIEISNNSAPTKEEERNLRKKLEKGMMINRITDYIADSDEESEGSGLGLVMILVMMKNSDIDPGLFRINFSNGKTIARLEIPFSDSYKSQRKS